MGVEGRVACLEGSGGNEIVMIRQSMVGAIAVVLLFLGVLSVGFYSHSRDSLFLSRQPTEEELTQAWGMPVESAVRLEDLEASGWALPRVFPANTERALVYDSFFGWRYYVFIDRVSGRVIGFYLGAS